MGGKVLRFVTCSSAVIALGVGVAAAPGAHAATAPTFLARYPGHFVTVEYQVPNLKWQTAVTNAIAEWNQSSNVHLTPYPSPRVSDGSSCVPDARSIRICVGNFGVKPTVFDNGLPVTAPTSATNVYRTTGASMIWNTAYGSVTARTAAFLSCWEIGSSLGLASRNESGTCMNGNGRFVTTAADAPNANDIALLTQLYTNP